MMGLYQDGNSRSPQNAIGGEVPLDAIGTNPHSGHQFRVTLTYDGVTLQAVVRDLILQTQIARTFTIDIPAITGKQPSLDLLAPQEVQAPTRTS